MLAHNMVNSEAKAYISASDPLGPNLDIDAHGGGVSVLAQDDATIVANVKLAAISKSTNDGGLSLLTTFADTVAGEYIYTDRSGVRDVVFGDQVRIDDSQYRAIEHSFEGREFTSGSLPDLDRCASNRFMFGGIKIHFE
ncbi:MAG: hypothetical protein IIC24_03485 [Chloroflexi bacterium]|nr:hypothetical protein [Chloroflexota bacterium]